jgi:hypothetical protein
MPSYEASIQHIKKARQGDYFEREFIFNTLDLTGKSAKCQIREEVGGPVILEFSTTNSKIVISGTSLKLVCPANEFTINPGMYVYDIEVYTTSADKSTLIDGTFEVITQTTQ